MFEQTVSQMVNDAKKTSANESRTVANSGGTSATTRGTTANPVIPNEKWWHKYLT